MGVAPHGNGPVEENPNIPAAVRVKRVACAEAVSISTAAAVPNTRHSKVLISPF